MKSWIFVRIASVVTLLYFAGHTAGAPWTPALGPGETAVVEAMKSRSFQAMGEARTYWDFYYGFGVAISAYLLAHAVVLWLVGSLARKDAVAARPFMVVLMAAFLVDAAIAWRYFFAVPAALALAIVACLCVAVALTRARAAS